VLRASHPLDPTHPNHRALVFMADDLARRSDGRMRLEVHASGQLGNSREALELLQVGSVDLTVASAASVESFVPTYRVFGLPYLFRDRPHRMAFFASRTGRELLRAGTAQRLRGLAYFDSGSRSFYTKDAVVDAPDDLRGRKVRVMNSPMAIATVRALGGSPTPIAWGELYTALQQGVVDAAENNPPSLVTSRHYEIARYYSLDEHTSIPDLLLVGEASWRRLGPRERQWLEASAAAAAGHQHRLWREAVAEAMRTLEDEGVTVHRPDKTPFVEAVGGLYESFAADNPALMPTVEAIREVRP
jgi:tripartite ATP-independent transporter DctP family solute receptor